VRRSGRAPIAGQQEDLKLLSRWFEKKEVSVPSASLTGIYGPKVLRHSGGWAALRKRLNTKSTLQIMDTGYTSPANVQYLTGLGHSVFLTDLVRDACTGKWQTIGEDGNPIWNVEGYLEHSLDFAGRTFDIVLLWTALDYLPEAFVVPVVTRLFEVTNPDGVVLAFFHTRTHGEETARCRYHVTPGEEVELQLTQQFPIQRAFSNRSIERLFAGWSGYRQFLAKDSVSEVIITR
jgi:hypothetical protein